MARTADGNRQLASYLDEAGLSPRALARELNRLFGPGTVAETAPYHWRDSGGIPRAPLPALTAYVISRRLGRIVTTDDLWHAHPGLGGPTLVLSATAGFDGPWKPQATMHVAEDWLMGGLVDRRIFLAATGQALVQAVSIYLAAQPPSSGALPASAPDDPLVDQIEASIPRLQQLDDEQGGAAGLNYVGAQVRAVLLLIRDGGHNDAVRRRLLKALADLAQLAGWKAVDAAQPGLAQRYLLTGLRAAHEAAYPAMEAHILADLAFQAASTDDPADGVTLGEAALRTAASAPASVHASVWSRLAFAYAAAGRTADCELSWQHARQRLEERNLANDPAWMYYLTPNHLDCQAGYSMILAGRNTGSTAAGRAILRQGETLLRTGVYSHTADQPSQRRALYEGAWLALGYTARGKLDDAADVLRLALPRLERVRSPRSVALLRQLQTDLRRRNRNTTAAELLPDLHTALARHST